MSSVAGGTHLSCFALRRSAYPPESNAKEADAATQGRFRGLSYFARLCALALCVNSVINERAVHAKPQRRIYEAGVSVKAQLKVDAPAPELVLVNRLFFDIKPS